MSCISTIPQTWVETHMQYNKNNLKLYINIPHQCNIYEVNSCLFILYPPKWLQISITHQMTKNHPLHLLEMWAFCSLDCFPLFEGNGICRGPWENWYNGQVLGKQVVIFVFQSQNCSHAEGSIYTCHLSGSLSWFIFFYVCSQDFQEFSASSLFSINLERIHIFSFPVKTKV